MKRFPFQIWRASGIELMVPMSTVCIHLVQYPEIAKKLVQGRVCTN